MIYFYDWLKQQTKKGRAKIINRRQTLRIQKARKELWTPMAERLETQIIKDKLKKFHVEHI